MRKHDFKLSIWLPEQSSLLPKSHWLPTPGNAIFTVVFTILVITGLLWAQTAGALPLVVSSAASTGTIAYQGRLADTAGAPLTGTYNMTFRLYSAASGGALLWEEPWNGANSVQVSDGLFNVMLGSLAAIPQNVVAANSSLFLGITVGTDSEMAPRVQLGSVPFAVQALTVPDGSVTTTKIADAAVTQAKLGADVNLVPPDGSITTAKLSPGAATGFWHATGTSSATTNQTGYALVPEMNLSIDTGGGPISIDFDTGFALVGDPNAAYVSFGIFVDGQEKTRHAQRVNFNGESTSMHISWAGILPTGQHSVQVRWAVSSTSVQANINAAGNIYEQRVLTVVEYRR